MRFLLRVLGFCFVILGIYVLGQNIVFTTNISPYWWRGIAADASILFLMAGVLMLIFSPRSAKDFGWILVTVAIVLVFLSSRVILNPTSLWQFFLSFVLIAGGYKLLTTGRLPF